MSWRRCRRSRLRVAAEVGEENSTNDSGDVLLGPQVILYLPPSGSAGDSKGGQTVSNRTITRPTVALGYLGRVHAGSAPDIDLGGFANSVLLLVSGDLGKFHYDTNYMFNEQTAAESLACDRTERDAAAGAVRADALK